MGGLFASRWWMVFASACGLSVGTGAILVFSFGVFLEPVTEDLGISRGDLSTALASATWITALRCGVVGWLIDRRGPLVPGVLDFALAVAGFGLMQAEPAYLAFLILGTVGFVGGIQSPVPYAAVVSRWFDCDRGIALGTTTAGVGLGVTLIPQLAAFLINRPGWRALF
jgi:sugar phosphate permease